MLNLVVEKGASQNRDRSGSSITWPKTGTLTRFVQRSRLDFDLGTSLYTVDIYIFFFFFVYCSSFDIISACISHSRRAFIHCYRHLFSHISIILSIFISINLIISSIF